MSSETHSLAMVHEANQSEFELATPENVISALTSALAAERYAATHDQLTGLLNREGLDRAYTERYIDTGRQPVMVKLDLLNFKAVNARLGEAGGDMVLMDMANIFRNSTRQEHGTNRPHDIIARLGGDEFVILTDKPDDPIEAEQAGERIRERIAHYTDDYLLGIPKLNEGHSVRYHVSSGSVVGELNEPYDSLSLRGYDKMSLHKEDQQKTHGKYRTLE